MSDHDDFYQRVGITFTSPKGDNDRRDEYEILRTAFGGFRARYVGYRHTEDGQEVMTGLALGGPGWREEVVIAFYRSDFDDIRFFRSDHDREEAERKVEEKAAKEAYKKTAKEES